MGSDPVMNQLGGFAMTKEELNTRRQRRAIMDAAANSWDPDHLADLANRLRRLSIPMQVTEDAADELERISKLKK
jgi:hypothetical protein